MDYTRKKPEVTTLIILEKRITKKDDTHPVKLRVTFNRTQKYYTISKKSFTSSDFENIISPKARNKNKELRRELEAEEHRAINIIDNEIDEFSFDEFERLFHKKKIKNNSLQSYFENKIDELKEENKLQTAISYQATNKSLCDFDSKVSFQRINPKYLKNYENWMIKKENTYTTIGIYLRNLRHILNRAIEDGVISHKKYPFGNSKNKYKIPAANNVKKALNIKDIEKIFKYEPISVQEAKAKAYWLFSYLCNGMNMVDIANLKFKNYNDNKIRFIRQKTKDTTNDKKEIIVSVLSEAKAIISEFGNIPQSNDYIFPIFFPGMTEVEKLNRLKQVIKNTNKYMKLISKKIGINENITTYYARHSYSTILKNSGASIEFISEQLGHSSIKVTANYLDSFEDEQRESISKNLINF